MNTALLVVLAIYVAGIARILVAWRRATRHWLDARVRPFDPEGTSHDGWVQVSSEDLAEVLGPYRESARPATDGSRGFAIRCELLLKPGPRDEQLRLRRWDVVERSVERHDFGLRVSTREVIPVVLANVDDQVEMELQPRGAVDDALRCEAVLADHDQITIEGRIEQDSHGKRLIAQRIMPDQAPIPDVNAASRTSYQALYWSIWMGLVAGVIVAAYLSPGLLLFLIVCALVLFVALGAAVPAAAALMLAVVWVLIRGEQEAPARTLPPPPGATYTAKDIVQLPLDVGLPTAREGQQHHHKLRSRR